MPSTFSWSFNFVCVLESFFLWCFAGNKWQIFKNAMRFSLFDLLVWTFSSHFNLTFISYFERIAGAIIMKLLCSRNPIWKCAFRCNLIKKAIYHRLTETLTHKLGTSGINNIWMVYFTGMECGTLTIFKGTFLFFFKLNLKEFFFHKILLNILKNEQRMWTKKDRVRNGHLDPKKAYVRYKGSTKKEHST